MAHARITSFGNIKLTNPKGAKGLPKRKRLSFDLTVEIDYPADMPDGVVRDYASTVSGWIENYAKAQASREQDSHRS